VIRASAHAPDLRVVDDAALLEDLSVLHEPASDIARGLASSFTGRFAE